MSSREEKLAASKRKLREFQQSKVGGTVPQSQLAAEVHAGWSPLPQTGCPAPLCSEGPDVVLPVSPCSGVNEIVPPNPAMDSTPPQASTIDYSSLLPIVSHLAMPVPAGGVAPSISSTQATSSHDGPIPSSGAQPVFSHLESSYGRPEYGPQSMPKPTRMLDLDNVQQTDCQNPSCAPDSLSQAGNWAPVFCGREGWPLDQHSIHISASTGPSLENAQIFEDSCTVCEEFEYTSPSSEPFVKVNVERVGELEDPCKYKDAIKTLHSENAQLRFLLEQHTSEVHHLRRDRDDILKKFEQQFYEDIEPMRKEIEQLRLNIHRHDLVQEIEALRALNLSAVSQKELSDKNLAVRTGECLDLNRQLQDCRTMEQELARTVVDLNTMVQQLNLDIYALNADKNKLESDCLSRSRESEELRHQLATITEKITQLSSESAFSSEAVKSLIFKQQTLQEDLKEKDVLLQRLAMEKSGALERLAAETDQSSRCLLEMRSTASRLEEEKSDLQQQCDIFALKLSQITQENDSLHQKLALDQKTMASEPSDLATLNQLYLDEKTKVMELESVLAERDKQLSELKIAVERMNEEILHQNTILETMHHDRERMSEYNLENRNMKESIVELQAKLDASTHALQVECHQNSAAEVKRVSDEFGARLKKKDEQLSQLIDDSMRSHEHNQAEMRAKQLEIQDLRRKISELSKDHADSIKALLIGDRCVPTSLLLGSLGQQVTEWSCDNLNGTAASSPCDVAPSLNRNNVHEACDHSDPPGRHSSDGYTQHNDQSDVPIEPGDGPDSHSYSCDRPEEDHQCHTHCGMDQHNCCEDNTRQSGQDHHLHDDRKHSDGFVGRIDVNEQMGKPDYHRIHQELQVARGQIAALTAEVKTLASVSDGLARDKMELYEKLELCRHNQAQLILEATAHAESKAELAIQQHVERLEENHRLVLGDKMERIYNLEYLVQQYQGEWAAVEQNFPIADVPYEKLKSFFSQLQRRHRELIDEKAALMDKLQDLEHKNMQLADECETIGEYVILYQMQRQALKSNFKEKGETLKQLANELQTSQSKNLELINLLKKTVQNQPLGEGDSSLLREVLNATALEHSTEALVVGADGIEPLRPAIANQHSSSSTSSADARTAEELDDILDKLDQAHPVLKHGWMSPSLRQAGFGPCKHCTTEVIVI